MIVRHFQKKEMAETATKQYSEKLINEFNDIDDFGDNFELDDAVELTGILIINGDFIIISL